MSGRCHITSLVPPLRYEEAGLGVLVLGSGRCQITCLRFLPIIVSFSLFLISACMNVVIKAVCLEQGSSNQSDWTHMCHGSHAWIMWSLVT